MRRPYSKASKIFCFSKVPVFVFIPRMYLLVCYDTFKHYRERIRQAERSGEFALSEALRDIIVQEQDHEIDLKDALGLR
jgi:hypothetical protein